MLSNYHLNLPLKLLCGDDMLMLYKMLRRRTSVSLPLLLLLLLLLLVQVRMTSEAKAEAEAEVAMVEVSDHSEDDDINNFTFFRLMDKQTQTTQTQTYTAAHSNNNNNNNEPLDQVLVSISYSQRLAHFSKYRLEFCTSRVGESLMNVDECKLCLKLRAMYAFVMRSHPIHSIPWLNALVQETVCGDEPQTLVEEIVCSPHFDSLVRPLIDISDEEHDDYSVQYLFSSFEAFWDSSLSLEVNTMCVLSPVVFSFQMLRGLVMLLDLDVGAHYRRHIMEEINDWNIVVPKYIQYFTQGLDAIQRAALTIAVELLIDKFNVVISVFDVDVLDWESNEELYDTIMPCDMFFVHGNQEQEMAGGSTKSLLNIVNNPYLVVGDRPFVPIIHLRESFAKHYRNDLNTYFTKDDGSNGVNYIRWDMIGLSVNAFQNWDFKQRYTCGWTLFKMSTMEFTSVRPRDFRVGMIITTLHNNKRNGHRLHDSGELHVFVSCVNHIFIETAYGLQYELNLLLDNTESGFDEHGSSEVLVMSEGLDYQQYLHLVSSQYLDDTPTAPRVLQIVLGAHIPQLQLIHNTILLHTENSWDTFMKPVFDSQRDFSTQRYLHLLGNALAVFVYSDVAISAIQPLLHLHFGTNTFTSELISDNTTGVLRVPTFHRIHFYSIPLYRTPLPCLLPKYLNNRYRDGSFNQSVLHWEISFVGSLSPHRENYLNWLIKQLKSKEFESTTIYFSQVDGILDPIDMYIKEFIFSHSKVIVNIHQYANTSLETHRINSIISLGRSVVSERSDVSLELDSFYADGIEFFDDWSQSLELLKLIISSNTTRKSNEEKARLKYCGMMVDNSELLLALTIAVAHLQPIDQFIN